MHPLYKWLLVSLGVYHVTNRTSMNDGCTTYGHRIRTVLKRDARIPKKLLKAPSVPPPIQSLKRAYHWNDVQHDTHQLTYTLQINSC